MRCFISIDLPHEIVDDLKKIQQQLPKNSKYLLVDANLMHITLKFFKEINEKEIEGIKETLKKISFSKFKARFDAIDIFTPKFIKVVYLSIAPKENFEKIHSLIDKMLSIEGFGEDKGFESHVTLARVKFVKDKKSFVEILNEINLPKKEFLIDSIKLKKSTLTPEGPVYEDLFEIKLN